MAAVVGVELVVGIADIVVRTWLQALAGHTTAERIAELGRTSRKGVADMRRRPCSVPKPCSNFPPRS